MEIWCDSASADVIRFCKQAWLKGITTNPKILSKQPIMAKAQLSMLLQAQPGLVGAQVTSTSAQGMLQQAKKLNQFSDRILVKVPCVPEGLAILPELIALKIPTLVTAVFKAEQFLMSAIMGVDYVAPYVSHMSREGINPVEEVKMMQAMINNYGFKTKVMAASIQDNNMIATMASLGVASITLSIENLLAWSENQFSLKSTQQLNEAWSHFKPYAGELFDIQE